MLLHGAGDFLGGSTGHCRGEKEVEAESVAFLTAAHVGLDTSDYTFGYVTGWAERAVVETGKAPHEIVQATGVRVVRAATRLTTALDDALGQGEPPAPADLALRVEAGVEAAAEVRAAAQVAATRAGLFDTPPAAGRAFPPTHGAPTRLSPSVPTPPATAPTAGRAGHRLPPPTNRTLANPSPEVSTVEEGAPAMPVPHQPTSDNADAATTSADPGSGTAVAEVISIRDWLAQQGGRVANTPSYLVDWLHQQIVAIVADPALTRAARLANVGEFQERFAAQLDAAITAGSDTHHPTGEDLFERYAHGGQFRAQLRAAAGIAAYTAVRADPALPPDEYRAAAAIPTRRQRVLIKAVEDHAVRYSPPHNPMGGLSPARYVAEAHVPGGASRTEWDWIAYYIAAHPEVLTNPPQPVAELQRRDRESADRLDRQSLEAFKAGDYQRSLDLIEEAELYAPQRDWDDIRTHVRHHMSTANPADAEPVATPTPGHEPGPAAGTAFAPAPAHVPVATPAASMPVATPHPGPARKSAQR
jgi:hypothetical protein